MAAGEGQLRSPYATLWVRKNFSLMPEENSEYASDNYSDSGSERDETSRNVVRWLESLPVDHQWYEAEEQIGNSESSEAVSPDGIPAIGDTDAPITLKSLQAVEPLVGSIEPKKITKSRKYRKGALHAAGTKDLSEPKKKSRESSTKISKSFESREAKSASTACRPIFRNPKIGEFLDKAMSTAIKRYKRNERNWDDCNNSIEKTNEPPLKKVKRALDNINKRMK